jgi:hypothetical protein
MNTSVFWDITPCSPLKINRRFVRTRRLHLQRRRISRTSVKVDEKQGSVPQKRVLILKELHGSYIPEDGALHKYRCQNLRSYILTLFSYRCLGLPNGPLPIRYSKSKFLQACWMSFLSHFVLFELLNRHIRLVKQFSRSCCNC